MKGLKLALHQHLSICRGGAAVLGVTTMAPFQQHVKQWQENFREKKWLMSRGEIHDTFFLNKPHSNVREDHTNRDVHEREMLPQARKPHWPELQSWSQPVTAKARERTDEAPPASRGVFIHVKG